MLAGIFATFLYFLLQGAGFDLPALGIAQAVGFALLCTIVLVAIMCIPVLIYCYFVKMIPDIDYSIRAAFILTVIGIISEFIF